MTGQNFRFPIDFAGHRYNSAAATTQPVVVSMVSIMTANAVGVCECETSASVQTSCCKSASHWILFLLRLIKSADKCDIVL